MSNLVETRWPIHPVVDQLLASPTLVINELSTRLSQAGKTVYRLGFGQSPFPVPEAVTAALQEHAAVKDYLPVLGLPALREAVAAWHQQQLDITATAEQVMIGPGSKQLIYTLLQAIDAPLLLPAPSWVSYAPQAELLHKPTHWLPTSAADNYCLTAKTLEGFLTQQQISPGILLLNYPNNPSGTTYTSTQLSTIADVCRQHNILVISDEIYGALHFAGQHESIARFYPEGTIITGGLSKWAGAGGWRLGTMIVPREAQSLLKACAKIASETFSAVSAPIQYAAVTAFSERTDIEHYLQHSRNILRTVAEYVHQRLAQMKVEAPKASGGFYLLPDFEHHRLALAERGIEDAEQMCADILETAGVALLPGTAFGLPAKSLKARLAYVDFDGAAALTTDLSPDAHDFIPKYCPRIVAAMNQLEHYLQRL